MTTLEHAELLKDVSRKIIHIKSRPTRSCVNNLYILLKKSYSCEVPKIEKGEYTYDNIIKFCDQTEKFVKNNNVCDTQDDPAPRKYASVKLEESLHLPNNIYVVDRDDDDTLYDAPLNIDDIDVSDSDLEENIEDAADDGDEYYDSGGDDFSQ